MQDFRWFQKKDEVFKGYSDNDLEKLNRAFSERPNYKTSTGYTGNKKSKKEKEGWKVGKKKRQTAHLSSKERRKLMGLHKQVDEIAQKASYIVSKKVKEKEGDLPRKRDLKKGNNANLGVKGIHSVSTYKDYTKKTKTFVKYCMENFKITGIDQITKTMFLDYFRDKLENGQKNGKPYSAKTINGYKCAILKFAEEAKTFGWTYKNFARLTEADLKYEFEKIKPTYSQDDYKRGKTVVDKEGNVRRGYSYQEARRLIKRAHEMSPLHGILYEVLAHAAPRISELGRIKWRQVDFENGRIYLDDNNQNKNNRIRYVQIPQGTADKLKAIMDAGYVKNPNDRIWGGRMSDKDIRNLTKDLCRQAHIGYSAVHDFRRAATEFHLKRFDKMDKKAKTSYQRKEFKEKLVKIFLDQVGVDDSLNPEVHKQVPALDKNGKKIFRTVLDKDGNPKRKSNGQLEKKLVWQKVYDADGNPVYDRKYTYENVKHWRIDKLKNSIVSQILGHNRTSATTPYKNG